jgi:hypothetical protein
VVSFKVAEMGGEIPRRDARLLPDGAATLAWNTDLASGVLTGLAKPELVVDLTGIAGVVKAAYRFPGPVAGVDPDVWLPLPSPYSSVVRSPLADDTLHRLYWTNPGEGAFWSTYARIASGLPPYNLGFTTPSTTVGPTITASGGDTTVPLLERTYLYTFVDIYGLESAPSLPSAVVSGASDGIWTVSGLPTTAPVAPTGKTYPPVAKVRVYRTTTGTTAAATFFLVREYLIAFPPAGGSFVDVLDDVHAALALQLASTSWAPPVDDLDGLVALPGGMLVGFSGNTIHFCEPDRPHAWPAAYDLSVQYPIMGLGIWNSLLMVLTQGYPSQGSGNHPVNFTLTQLQVTEPCIARGSIVTDFGGVAYASQNGVIVLSSAGMQNTTEQLIAKRDWLTQFNARDIIACRHRNQYLALNGATGTGFVLDYTEERQGLVRLNTFLAATAIWNDPYNGDAYIMAGKRVYRWDSPTADRMIWRWRSKRFALPAAANLGACQMTLSDDVVTAAAQGYSAPPLNNGDPALSLPAGVACIFKLYANEGVLIHTQEIAEAQPLFRLPSGFKAYDYQFEIIARTPVARVELASTMRELAGV